MNNYYFVYSGSTGQTIGGTCSITFTRGNKKLDYDIWYRIKVSYDNGDHWDFVTSYSQSLTNSFTINPNSSYFGNWSTMTGCTMRIGIEEYNKVNGNYHGIKSSLVSGIEVTFDYTLSPYIYDKADAILTYNTYKNSISDLLVNLSKLSAIFRVSKHYDNTIVSATLNGEAAGFINNSYADFSSITAIVDQADEYVLVLTDSRGFTSTTTFTGSDYSSDFKTVQYTDMDCTHTVTRQSPTSTSLDIDIEATFYDGTNLKTSALETPTVTFEYSTDNGSTWTTATLTQTLASDKITISDSTTSSDATFYKKTCNYRITVTDKINRSKVFYGMIPPGEPAFYSFLYNNQKYTNFYDNLLLDWKPVATTDDTGDLTSLTTTDKSNLVSAINEINSDLYYSSGDVIEIGSTTAPNLYVTNGYITSSTTTLFLTIQLPKRLDNITSITVNNVNVEARGESGYLNSSSGFHEYVGSNNYTVTATKVSENAITLLIVKSSAWTNTSNNRLVGLAGYFKFTLS